MYAVGDSSLISRLDALDHRINELTRRSPRSVRCIVRLNVDVVAWPAEQLDVVVNSSWKTTPEIDTDGMWYPGTDSYVLIPFAGRYRILVHSRWAEAVNYQGNFPNVLSCSVLLNGTDPIADGVAEQTAFHHPYANVGFTLASEDRIFAPGDRLKFNFWSRWSGPRMLASSLDDYTHFSIAYLGAQ